MKFLGYIIQPQKREDGHKHTAILLGALPPTNNFKPLSFLGLCKDYQRLVRKYAYKKDFLHTLLQQYSADHFLFKKEILGDFSNIIGGTISSPFLSLPQLDPYYSVEIHASADSLGCCLRHTSPTGSQCTISFWYYLLVPASQKCSASERKSLAILWTFEPIDHTS